MFIIKIVNPYLMNDWGECLAYTKLRFSVNGDIANLHQEAFHFIMKLNVYSNDKIISS
jgi:hypothetical protein